MVQSARVVQHVLSPAKAATREKLLEAAINLAAEGGYEAVSVRSVAAEAGTSVPTAYQHVSSKDHLLVEALMMLGEQSSQQLRQRPPKGRTPAERISAVFGRIMRAAHDQPLLYQALYRGWIASAPAVNELEGAPWFGPDRASWIGDTLRAGNLGGLTEQELDNGAKILSCLFLGALIEVASGRNLDEVVDLLTNAAHKLLRNNAT